MSTLPPGYRILSQIGVGARSTISKVVHEKSGQYYAFKRVVRSSADDDRFIEQAEAEHAVAGTVKHPNLRFSHTIRRVRKWFQVVELGLVMEYVEGRTLEEQRPRELPEVLAVFRKAADGLDALHEAGYVHADLKPSNIVVGDHGVVKVIDLGQSCRLGERKQRIQGTPDYIAPEQVRRLPLDRRTDLFNLGATLYWVLTGATYPTQLQGMGRSAEVLRPKSPPAPRELNPEVPVALSNLVMECCSDNPADRPADVAQFKARFALVERVFEGRERPAAIEVEANPREVDGAK